MVYTDHLTWVIHGILSRVKHGISFIPALKKKCLRYMLPAMYCTLWREPLDAENDIKAFLNLKKWFV